jgi:hypothetical protein
VIAARTVPMNRLTVSYFAWMSAPGKISVAWLLAGSSAGF